MTNTQHPVIEEIDPSVDFYLRKRVHAFMETREDGNLLSTLTKGEPLTVNGLSFHTPEALFQALKFPNHPEMQKAIARQEYGTDARSMAQEIEEIGRRMLRADWEEMKIPAMVYTTAVTLSSRQETAEELLKSGTNPIVQIGKTESYWSAKPDPDVICLIGRNVMGKILTEMREEIRAWDNSARRAAFRFSTEIPRGRLILNNREVPPSRRD